MIFYRVVFSASAKKTSDLEWETLLSLLVEACNSCVTTPYMGNESRIADISPYTTGLWSSPASDSQ